VLTFAITPAIYVDDGPPTLETLAEMKVVDDEDDAED
jgi:hypothetical protein